MKERPVHLRYAVEPNELPALLGAADAFLAIPEVRRALTDPAYRSHEFPKAQFAHADDLRRALNQTGKLLIERGGNVRGLSAITRVYEQLGLLIHGEAFETKRQLRYFGTFDHLRDSLSRLQLHFANAIRSKLFLRTLATPDTYVLKTITDVLHVGLTLTEPHTISEEKRERGWVNGFSMEHLHTLFGSYSRTNGKENSRVEGKLLRDYQEHENALLTTEQCLRFRPAPAPLPEDLIQLSITSEEGGEGRMQNGKRPVFFWSRYWESNQIGLPPAPPERRISFDQEKIRTQIMHAIDEIARMVFESP